MGDRTIDGLQAGKISDNSTQAINGSQLHASLKRVAENLGGGADVDENGLVTAPNYSDALGANALGVDVMNGVEGGFKYVGDRLAVHDGEINDLSEGKRGLVQLEDMRIVINNDIAKEATIFDISNIDDMGKSVARTLTGVAEGVINQGSYDAINGSQLAAIFGEGAYFNKTGELVAPRFDFGQADLSLHGALTHLHGRVDNIVKPIEDTGTGVVPDTGGNITPGGSTGGNDLPTTGIFVSDGSAIIVSKEGAGAGATELNLGQVNDKGEAISMKVTGVGVGNISEKSTDVINGSQLWETNQNVAANTSQINSIKDTLGHYNTRLKQVEKTVHQNRKIASAGTASAMAMSSIPYVEYAKYSMGMGVAHYDGETAMSIGVTWKSSDRSRFRIQGSFDSQNKAGIGAGVAFEL